MSREKAIELLKQAVCPKCDNSGRICEAEDDDMDYQVEWEDCQWCKERSKVLELLESEPDIKSPLEYPYQLHINEKTKEGYYVTLRTLIPEDLFERTKKSVPPAGEFTKELRASIFDQNDGLVPVEKDLIYVPAKIALEACSRIDRLEAELKAIDVLLKAAKCPDCDGDGAYYDNYGNVCQCQWCYEVEEALKGEWK